MYKTVNKPGFMFRACLAWLILNSVLVFTLAVTVYIMKAYLDHWYVSGTLLVAVTASEWIIMAETIAPIVKDWIKQEESVEDGQQPSWKQGKS